MISLKKLFYQKKSQTTQKIRKVKDPIMGGEMGKLLGW
jgi:hypothetical protein